MKYTKETTRETLSKNPRTPIIYFWGHHQNGNRLTNSCLSQWYDTTFEIDGVKYHTAEQYMMAKKAMLFNDKHILEKIMSESEPRAYKALGRKIIGFDSAVWDLEKYNIVLEGNKAKFSQNNGLNQFLLSTGNAILVEASPYDRIWGIGIDRETALSGTVDDWKGENLLGFALMETRDFIGGH